ncbi:MAG: 2-oxo acid dehydrogenase subunit E2 [Crocinitomicaceae bacterium]|nr:2-oxo acid dehydrogenase subunit E2 [Crocinitomicaceae bacterium]MBT6030900.1 2-oxo acid dehydrogenase subunit E2 [Crocinitomicaceae bacterium]MBT6514893.1 2-oxo acid dehydrogenase subunit E2 [Crocinitomicaceae bacterium]
MAEIVRMPKLSDTMVEGVVAEWHKNIGDAVSSGDLLAEIETDKATMEFESFYDGVLLHIGVDKGATAPVNDILAIIGEKDEDVKKILAEEVANLPEEKSVSSKEEVKAESKPDLKISEPVSTKVEVAVNIAPTYSDSPISETIKASPLAKKLAEDRGINLNQIKGSGEGGRIIKRDIDNYQGGLTSFIGVESYAEEPVSQMRKIIAQRLGESKFSAPHFYLTIEVDMDNAISARNSINNAIAPQKISFNDMVIKTSAAALKKHPKVNSSWLGDKIRYNSHVHIGVAVAVDEGLLVPVIRFADGKSLTQIGAEVKDFAGKARDKKLQPEDWEGNTFTISNLGMFGIEEFTAIINPPDACILAIGGIVQKPVVKNNQVVIGNTMKVTLSCDHRVVDGVVGSSFLQTFKNYLENPVVFLAANNI